MKTTVLSGATCLVSNGNNISSRSSPNMKARQILKRDKRPRPVLVFCFTRFAAYDIKADKLPLETEPVARDNNTIFTLKPGDRTLSCLTQLIIVVLPAGINLIFHALLKPKSDIV